MHPILILLLGMAIVIGMIVVLRIGAFLSLITAAITVSLLSPGDWAANVSGVATAFGETAGKIGIVIAAATIIGKCLMESGAFDQYSAGWESNEVPWHCFLLVFCSQFLYFLIPYSTC